MRWFGLTEWQNTEYTVEKESAKDVLEDRIKVLSEKIRKILETVAPMKKNKLDHRGKPRWLSKEL